MELMLDCQSGHQGYSYKVEFSLVCFFPPILKTFNFATHLKYSILKLPLPRKWWFHDKLFVNKNNSNLQIKF